PPFHGGNRGSSPLGDAIFLPAPFVGFKGHPCGGPFVLPVFLSLAYRSLNQRHRAARLAAPQRRGAAAWAAQRDSTKVRMRSAASTHSASGATRAMRSRLLPGFTPSTSRDR